MIALSVDLDQLSLAAIRAGALAGRPVAVLGLARSGVALARFLLAVGAQVTVYDRRTTDELTAEIEQLQVKPGDRPIRLLAGPEVDPAEAVRGMALVSTSPAISAGYPTTEPRLRSVLQGLVAGRAAGDLTLPAIVSEVDLFLRLCPAVTIGVTGTKGKTTTSALIGHLLGADPRRRTIVGGNIGRPLVDHLLDLRADDRVVVELSELQLPTLSRGTHVAVYTNVTSDHLDRHGSVEAYRRVKRRLAELVDPEGALVLNADDPTVVAYAGLGTAPDVLYRLERPIRGGLGIIDGWIVADALERLPLAGGGNAGTGPGGRILPLAELPLPGRHNVSNALAAISVALLFGLAPDAIRAASATFRGVEHRLEPIGERAGVRFVNDSQGTQPDAVIAALRSYPAPIVLIAGGRDKGVDLGPLAPVVAERAAAAVLIGESGPTLERLFRSAGLARAEQAATLEIAVRRADQIAREIRAGLAAGRPDDPDGIPRATVLLSPAAASFDMFRDYEARGEAFRAAVNVLLEEARQ